MGLESPKSSSGGGRNGQSSESARATTSYQSVAVAGHQCIIEQHHPWRKFVLNNQFDVNQSHAHNPCASQMTSIPDHAPLKQATRSRVMPRDRSSSRSEIVEG